MANVSLSLALIAWISKKSKCSVSKLVNWQMTYMIFFGLCSMLSVLGNFVFGCHI